MPAASTHFARLPYSYRILKSGAVQMDDAHMKKEQVRAETHKNPLELVDGLEPPTC